MAAPETGSAPPFALAAPPRPAASPPAPASSRPPSGPAPAAAPATWRERVVEAARRRLGRTFAGDCSSFVRRSYVEAGLALPVVPARSASESLYRGLHPIQRPQPGDLAFFHGSFDRKRDGRGRDRFTHVALVEEVDGPAVALIHRSSRGIERLSMNLASPHDPSENGSLRMRRAGDRPGLRYLSGELFAGYASPSPARAAATASR